MLFCIFILVSLWGKKHENQRQDILQANQHKLKKSPDLQMKKNRIANSKKGEKTVYLTFDDGPSQWTDAMLDVLQEYEVQATFFMVGNNLQKSKWHPSVRRASEEGHYIGAHSMTHEYDILYTQKKFVPEMEQTIQIIEEITGVSPNLVRAPYGSLPGLRNDTILANIASAKMKVWDWTIDTKDWEKNTNENKILQTLQEHTHRDVEIILLHEKEQTLHALPQIITFFIEQGYAFEVYQEEHHFPNNFLGDDNL